MLMPYSECRSDLGFASPPVLPPYVFRNRIGCFRLQLSAGRLPLPGRGHLSASFFIRSGLLSCRISLCGEPIRSSTAVRVRLSARLSAFLRSGFNCRPGDPLFSGPDSAAGPAVCIPHTAVCPVVFSFGPEAIACLIVCSSAVRLQLPVR